MIGTDMRLGTAVVDTFGGIKSMPPADNSSDDLRIRRKNEEDNGPSTLNVVEKFPYTLESRREHNIKVLQQLFQEALVRDPERYSDPTELVEQLPDVCNCRKRVSLLPYLQRIEAAGTITRDVQRRGLEGADEMIDSHLKLHERMTCDIREYLSDTGAKNQRFAREVFEEAIIIACRDGRLEDAAARIAFAFFDVNGLKGVNDCLGHENGNKVLELVCRALAGLHLKLDGRVVTSFAAVQSGDEFNGVFIAPVDLRGRDGEIAHLIEDELAAVDTQEIISTKGLLPYEKTEVEKGFLEFGVNLHDPQNRYILSVSIGMTTLAEAFDQIELTAQDTFESAMGKLKMFVTKRSDMRSGKYKRSQKLRLAGTCPLMARILSFRETNEDPE